MICNLAGCVWARPHATKQVCHQVFAVHILSSYLVVVRGAVVSFAWADQNSGNTTFFAVCSCQRPTSLCFRHTKAVPECSIMQCFAGYRRCQSIQGKQGQSGNNRPAVPPDTSMLSPELQQQWYVEGNMHLGAIKVKPTLSIKAVWQCNKCPAGQPHIWTATVSSRAQRGTQCPYCSNRLVCKHNSLATLAPKVARYWHYSKNNTTPEQVLAGSNFRAEWQCPACKWEWQAPISMRTRSSAGCPKCSRAKRVTHPPAAHFC